MTTSVLIPPGWQLPPAIVARVGDRVGRQRIMVADGHLLLVLHAPPKSDERERRARLFWRSPDGQWRSSQHGDDELALGRHLLEFEKRLTTYERNETLGEVELLRRTLEGLVPLQRTVNHLHAALQDARQAVPEDRSLINDRDQAYELERTAEILLQDVRHDLEFAAARHEEQQTAAAHQMAVAAHRLNVMAALFFPLATVSAVMGMNMAPAIPQFAPPPIPFFSIILGALAIGVILALNLRKPK